MEKVQIYTKARVCVGSSNNDKEERERERGSAVMPGREKN